MFETAELGITCPKCGTENKKTVAWIKANDNLVCAGCNETIRLEKSSFVHALDQADKGVDDLRRNIKNLNRKLGRKR